MKANDPDRFVATWLRKGAPAGIIHHAQQAGIFPPTGSREEAAMERALNEYRDGHLNYLSMEEELEGEKGVGGACREEVREGV